MLCEERQCYHDSVCEATTIEQLLCHNILLEILSYLNAIDLQTASLVCKRWNEVIGSSTATMKKLTFQISPKILQLQRKNFGSNRNHQNYVIQVDDSIDWTSIADNIRLNRVKSFHIRRSRFCEIISSEVILFLSSLAELEKLTVEGVQLMVMEELPQPIEMPKLNSLQIDADDFTILEHIDANELQELRCIGKGNSNLKDIETIAHSIVGLSQLKRLILWNCMETFEYIDVHKVKFKLNDMDVYHINVNPIDVSVFAENMHKFLLLQANSFRHLRFDFSMLDVEDGPKIVNDFLQLAFNECSNLSSLDIRNLSISRDDNFYQSLSPNHSIRSLKVHWNFDGNVIDGLLRNCPKLEKLEAEFCYLSDNGVKSIATLCRKLIQLDTFKLIGVVDADTVCYNLKYLSIFKVGNSFDPLMSLVAKCPVIEQIRIFECFNIESFPMDIIMHQQLSMRKLIIEDKCYEIYTDADERRMVRQSQLQDY